VYTMGLGVNGYLWNMLISSGSMCKLINAEDWVFWLGGRIEAGGSIPVIMWVMIHEMDGLAIPWDPH